MRRPHRRPWSLALPVVLVALLAAAGCSPAPVYRLQSLAPGTGHWEQGQRYVRQAAGVVEVELAYERTTDEGHAFWVAVANRGETALLVDPTTFYAVPAAVPDTVVALWGVGPDTLWAVDPEARLLQLDLAASRADARRRTERGLDAVVAVTEVLAGEATADERAADALERTEHAAEHAADVDRRGLRRRSWAGEALRKTTVPPGGWVEGLVFFPVERGRRYLTVHVPGRPGAAAFPFVVHRYQP